MNDHTLEKLQFDRVRDALAGHCGCRLGKALARRLRPTRNARQVRHWLGQVKELAEVRDDIGLPPMGGVRDVRAEIRASDAPAGLDPEQLADVGQCLLATGILRGWIGTLPSHAPLLSRLGERVGDFSVIGRAIDDAIDPQGKVRDTASTRLRTIRGTIDRARQQSKMVVDRLLKQTRIQRMLQYVGSTFHDDRIVLPLKTEHRGRIPGIVHRSSDSGATMFLEPAEAVELNNTIARLRYDEHQEITRILFGLTQQVHRNAAEILRTLGAIAVLDLIAAKVRYADQRQAVCPEIRDDGVLDLHGARHPVLIELFTPSTDGRPTDDGHDTEQRVVPIDVRLGDDFDLLVVTGPNTGGKTVALKTVGLCAVMAQAGIPIPVAPGSSMPVYQGVFIDVGDEQSLEQSLSTFSSHLSNILDILARARRDSLVLIDELGSGTDPDEGAAIGRAIMDKLLQTGCAAVLTTHLSVLKAAAFSESRVDNAAVEFDTKTLRPTYRLLIGEPGVSNAIAIAERLGMPDRMVRAAREHLAGRHRALTRAIAGTLASRREAERARHQAHQARLQADASRAAYRKRLEAAAHRETEFQRWREWITALRRGDEVYVPRFARRARVVRMQLHKQTAIVSAGPVDLELPLEDLHPPVDSEARGPQA